MFKQSIQLLTRYAVRSPIFPNKLEIRHHKRWVAPTLREMFKRKEAEGPTPDSPRSSHLEWNYDAEIYAFGQRLGEEFKDEILKKALTHKSFINQQEIKLKNNELLMDVRTDDNWELIRRGEEIISNYINAYFKHTYPVSLLRSVEYYLTNDKMLAHCGTYLGLKDIILTAEYPVEEFTIANTFKAIVAALEESSGLDPAELFIKDFLIVQLKGKDLFEVWEVKHPYDYLKQLTDGKEIEPRLCNQSAVNTVLSNYQVGLYDNKQLIGLGWGETIEIAKDSAALDAIQKFYKLEKVF